MSKNNTLHDEIHFKVLRQLEANPNLNQRKLAEALGISLGKTNFCLQALINKGLLKIENFRSNQNKLSYAYLLTSNGIVEKAALTARFLQRKQQEFDAIKAELESLKQEVANQKTASAPIH